MKAGNMHNSAGAMIRTSDATAIHCGPSSTLTIGSASSARHTSDGH